MPETSGFDAELIARYRASLAGAETPAKSPAPAQKPAGVPLRIYPIDDMEATGVLLATQENRDKAMKYAESLAEWKNKNTALKSSLLAFRQNPDDSRIRSDHANRLASQALEEHEKGNPPPKMPKLVNISKSEELLAAIAYGSLINRMLGGADRHINPIEIFQKDVAGEHLINVPVDGAVTATWDEEKHKYRVYVHPAQLPKFDQEPRPGAFDGDFILLSREDIQNHLTLTPLDEGRKSGLATRAEIPITFASRDPRESIENPLLFHVENTDLAGFKSGGGVKLKAVGNYVEILETPNVKPPAPVEPAATEHLESRRRSLLTSHRPNADVIRDRSSGRYRKDSHVSGGDNPGNSAAERKDHYFNHSAGKDRNDHRGRH